MFGDFLQAAILVLAVSADAFFSAFAYGIKKINIPFKSVMVISGVCTGFLAVSLFAGGIIRGFLPGETAKWLCFLILFALGLVKLLDNGLKAIIRKYNAPTLKFKVLSLNFILKVYANPEEADEDRSKTLSPAEAAALAIALSLDGLAAGVGTALGGANKPLIVTMSLAVGILAISAGCFLGNKVANSVKGKSKSKNSALSWLGGAGLIALAVYKLF